MYLYGISYKPAMYGVGGCVGHVTYMDDAYT